MLYLHIYDADPKKSTAQKLIDACAAYVARFGDTPDTVLVNEADKDVVIPGCEVRVERRVGPSNYQVGKSTP
jgi:hypothetical protein